MNLTPDNENFSRMHGNINGRRSDSECDHYSNAPQVVAQSESSTIEVCTYLYVIDHEAKKIQVVPSSAPEIAYREAPLCPVTPVVESTGRDLAKPSHTPRPRSRFRSKKIWLAISVALVASIALGVGLGVGLKSRHDDGPNPTTTRYRRLVNSKKVSKEFHSSQPGQAQPSTTPIPTILPPHSVIESTSLASLFRLNGERHVFFQDQGGIIREAVYQQASWNASTSSVVAKDARNNTPLAAFSVPPVTGARVETVSRAHPRSIAHSNRCPSALPLLC